MDLVDLVPGVERPLGAGLGVQRDLAAEDGVGVLTRVARDVDREVVVRDGEESFTIRSWLAQMSTAWFLESSIVKPTFKHVCAHSTH